MHIDIAIHYRIIRLSRSESAYFAHVANHYVFIYFGCAFRISFLGLQDESARNTVVLVYSKRRICTKYSSTYTQ